jgi:YHS domain-containing protein
MSRIFLIILFAILLQFSSVFAIAGQPFNLDDKGRALHGYDPVSYYTDTPEKGNSAITHEYQGVQYHFASQENREKFVNSPEKYQFAYGGYCAWAMLEGQKVDVDPERYKKVNGVVYLFYNTFFTDTLDKWNDLAEKETEQKLISRADDHWRQIASM